MNLSKKIAISLLLICLQPTFMQAMNDDDSPTAHEIQCFQTIEQFASLNNAQIKNYLIECKKKGWMFGLLKLVMDKYPTINEEVTVQYHYANISDDHAQDTEQRFPGKLLQSIQNYSRGNLQYLTGENTKSALIKKLAKEVLDKK